MSMAWSWVNTYEDRADAQREADEVNAALPERPNDPRVLLSMVAGAYPLCMECDDWGYNGTFMGCGFEHVVPAYYEGGICGERGWHNERDRCLLRSWVEAEGCGIDADTSKLGTANEWEEGDTP